MSEYEALDKFQQDITENKIIEVKVQPILNMELKEKDRFPKNQVSEQKVFVLVLFCQQLLNNIGHNSQRIYADLIDYYEKILDGFFISKFQNDQTYRRAETSQIFFKQLIQYLKKKVSDCGSDEIVIHIVGNMKKNQFYFHPKFKFTKTDFKELQMALMTIRKKFAFVIQSSQSGSFIVNNQNENLDPFLNSQVFAFCGPQQKISLIQSLNILKKFVNQNVNYVFDSHGNPFYEPTIQILNHGPIFKKMKIPKDQYQKVYMNRPMFSSNPDLLHQKYYINPQKNEVSWHYLGNWSTKIIDGKPIYQKQGLGCYIIPQYNLIFIANFSNNKILTTKTHRIQQRIKKQDIKTKQGKNIQRERKQKNQQEETDIMNNISIIEVDIPSFQFLYYGKIIPNIKIESQPIEGQKNSVRIKFGKKISDSFVIVYIKNEIQMIIN